MIVGLADALAADTPAHRQFRGFTVSGMSGRSADGRMSVHLS
ncbi:MAG: hypothetical protein QOF10_2292 [Kribbellaceae bacterium]|jgi:hypothetical protein|nr:hypothetical protein [Kribbellaceae bacterium]